MPVLASSVSSGVFQIVFVHLVYNSVLFLASWFCSFLLNVVVSLNCNFLVEELKTNVMSLVVFISLIFAQHVSNNITFKPSTEKASLFRNKAQERQTHYFKWPLTLSPNIPHKQNSSASTCKLDTTKHHPQQTPTHNEKRYVLYNSQTHIQSTSKKGTKYQITNEKYHTQTNTMNTQKHNI